MPSRRRFIGMTAMAVGGFTGYRTARDAGGGAKFDRPAKRARDHRHQDQNRPDDALHSGPISAYGAIGRAQLADSSGSTNEAASTAARST